MYDLKKHSNIKCKLIIRDDSGYGNPVNSANYP